MPKPTLYLSGPISGLPDLNRKAFADAAKKLRGMGYYVINPHEICEGLTADQWQQCMRRCIAKMMEADTLIMLDGWKKSRGANIELNLAIQLELNHSNYNDFLKTHAILSI